MLKYLELCVDLRKSHLAKEGLYQYKNICQQVCHPIIQKKKKYFTSAESYTKESYKSE